MTTSASAPASTGFVLKGWHVLAMLLAFFATVIGVDVGFSIMAVRTFPGEDVKHSYVQGNHYNELLAERARQARLGWRATAAIETRAGAPAVVLTLRDKAGKPLEGLAVTGLLRRPATTRADRTLAFASAGDGVYAAPVTGLAPGAWDMEVTAARGSDTFDVRARLAAPDSAPETAP